jgi:hypothetical protein
VAGPPGVAVLAVVVAEAAVVGGAVAAVGDGPAAVLAGDVVAALLWTPSQAASPAAAIAPTTSCRRVIRGRSVIGFR